MHRPGLIRAGFFCAAGLNFKLTFLADVSLRKIL
jgi:hypothetical protein